MQLQRLADLCAHGHHRVEAQPRFLKHHCHAPAAHAAHGALRQSQDVVCAQMNRATAIGHAIRQQAHERERSHGFAAAGFTQQGEGLALGNIETDAIHDACAILQLCQQISNAQQAHAVAPV